MRIEHASVLITTKNFSGNPHVSHIGLGISALNNQKVLRSLGLAVEVVSIVNANELSSLVDKKKYTHVVISAPWIPTQELARLAHLHQDTRFYVNCHSNVGFLQADRNGVKLFREALELEQGTHNFHVAGNCTRFTEWVEAAYGVPCAYLPNCYFLDRHVPSHRHGHHSHGPIRIGVFGATRPLKNILSAAGAALEIARDLNRPLEFWVSSGREEGGEAGVIKGAMQNLLGNLPGVEIHYTGWQTWPQFRKTVGHMDLLLQPSYTESFNMVTADGIAEGVSSVVSEAIDWAPEYWKADVDNVLDIARHGKAILANPHANQDGLKALVRHNHAGCKAWAKALRLSDLPEYGLCS